MNQNMETEKHIGEVFPHNCTLISKDFRDVECLIGFHLTALLDSEANLDIRHY